MKHTGVMTFTVGWGDCSPSGASSTLITFAGLTQLRGIFSISLIGLYVLWRPSTAT